MYIFITGDIWLPAISHRLT